MRESPSGAIYAAKLLYRRGKRGRGYPMVSKLLHREFGIWASRSTVYRWVHA